MEFYEDKGLNPRFRSRLADFKDSGYDRGHMVGLSFQCLWRDLWTWLHPSYLPCTLELFFTA